MVAKDGAPNKKRKVSRETQYKRKKKAESVSRNLSTSSTPAKAATRNGITNGKGKAKAKEMEDNPHPFRYKSFNDRLASVHINIGTSLGRSGTGALAGLEGHGVLPVAGSSSRRRMDVDNQDVAEDSDDVDDEDDDDEGGNQLHAKTSFGIAVLSWKELNLSLPFTVVLQQIQPLSLSLPMLLHHQTKITRLLEDGLLASHRDSYNGYEPLLDLIPRLATDLGSSFLPSFPALLAAIMRVTTISKLNTDGEEYVAANLVERAFESAAATLRCMAPFILREQDSKEGGDRDWLQSTWHIVRSYLGRSDGTRLDEESMLDDEGDGRIEDFQKDEVQEDEEAQRIAAQSTQMFKKGKVPMHTRRFASEALAHLVRRAKGDQLDRIARVMMADAQEELRQKTHRSHVFASGIAAIWAEVAKSVDGRLHSSAITQLSALLLPEHVDLGEDDVNARNVVGSDVITALVHHSKAAHLVNLFEWLADLAEGGIGMRCEVDAKAECEAQIRLSWLIAFIGTRKGKRVDDAVKGRLFGLLERAAALLTAGPLRKAQSTLRTSLVQLVTLSLPLGRIQDLIGPGKKVVDSLATPLKSADIPQAFVAIAKALARPEFEFAGFRQVVLPAVMSATTQALRQRESTEAQEHALIFLASLHQEGLFTHLSTSAPTSASTMWLNVVAEEIERRLSLWADAIEGKSKLGSESDLACLTLVTLLSSRADQYIDLLCRCIRALALCEQATMSSFHTSPINQASLLGTALLSTARLVESGNKTLAYKVREQLEKGVAIVNLPKEFAWHRQVTHAFSRLASIMHERGSTLPSASLDDLLPTLIIPLMSEDERLRLAAAQLLAIAEERQLEGGTQDLLLTKVVDIEQTPLEVETVRERNVRMRALAREVVRRKQSGEDSGLLSTLAKAIASYLVSVCKLNFRPLWEESRKALVDLSAAYGQLVWETALSELRQTQIADKLPSAWRTLVEANSLVAEAEDDESIDKQFRDPQLVQRRGIVSTNLEQAKSYTLVQGLIEAQRPGGRLDTINYHGLLLKLMASIPILAERNNAPLMQHFFDTIVARNDEPNEEDIDDEDVEEEGIPQQQLHPLNKLNMAQRRAQLCAYLETFAQFSNPKALFRSRDLHQYLYRLCCQGDSKIQGLALDVILRWKDPAHTTYSAMLKKLLEQNSFREELTSLDLTPGGDSIQLSHRGNLLPLMIRLFFGIMVSKRGRASQGSGQMGRKNAILTALSQLPVEELKPLIDVMLEPFEDQQSECKSRFTFSLSPPRASTGRQAGFLSLLGDVIKHLGLSIVPLWDQLVGVTLNLTYHASKRAEAGQGKVTQADRSLRQSGIRRLDDFFKRPTSEYDWTTFLPALFEQLVSPRLGNLRVESIQSPSALLDLIHTWSNDSGTVMLLVDYDIQLLEHVCACLQMPTVKPSVTSKILDIIEAVQSFTDVEVHKDGQVADLVKGKVLQPNISTLLAGLAPLVQRCNAISGIDAKHLKKDELSQRLLHILSHLTPYIRIVSDATLLLDALSPMMRKNNAVIAEKSKVDLLHIHQRLLSLIPEMRDPTSPSFQAQYELLSGLFSRLRSRSARLALCNAFQEVAKADPSLLRVVAWLQDLNSFDVKRMEEYDFERRLAVYDAINETVADPPITPREWLPLLHNFLFNLQDAEELAIRANAASALRRFIDVVEGAEQQCVRLFTHVVYPGLRRGLRNKSTLVQREVVSLLGYAVTKLASSMPYLDEMTGLLVSGDEEASFFNNVFHIQLHRRIRALHRLGQEAEKGSFSSRLIVDVFQPLVDQFLNTDSHHGDANLIQTAVECLGKLSMRLKWGPYNVLLWKFLSIGKKSKDGEKEKEKDKSDKVCVRAAMSILDNFHFEMEDAVAVEEAREEAREDDDDEADREQLAAAQEAERVDSKKVLDAVQNRLLPKLMDFLDMKDDLEDTVRLPIAVGVARVMLKLPQPTRRTQIAKLLATLANVFKSKAQDTRDLARVTLGKVAASLGPAYLPVTVKELRRALVRGPQKAVLAFTVHNLLIQLMSKQEGPLTILHTGTSDIVDVVIEDVFGQTSEDRDSIENRTTYKEVKSIKSFDTLEQVGKIVDPAQVGTLLTPIKDLMHQTEAVKAVKSMDDYLKRVAAGLNVNPHLSSGDFLLLCHSLLTSNADFLRAPQSAKRKQGRGLASTSAVLKKRSEIEDGGADRNHYARNAYKFVVFGLDLLSNALRRGKLNFSDQDTLAKLDPMIGAVGNCLYAQHAAIITASLRVLAMLIKCPVPAVQASLALVIRQTLKIVEKEGSNAQSDILIASLKLLTVVLRDVDSSSLHEKQVTQLCQLIDANLEEDAELQGVLFGLLRAIVARKFVVPEVYDVMDKVANMMVTNQGSSIRESCRSTYLTFLLEFPQGQQRFSNQMHFFAKNINYVFESGRLSLLDFLRLIFIKMDETVLREYLNLFFVSLVMCLGNDDSSKCKESAAKLIVQIVELARPEEREKFVDLVHLWAQGDKRDLVRIAMMIYGLFAEAPTLREVATWKSKALISARRTLAAFTEELNKQEMSFDDETNAGEWQLPYQALQVVNKLYRSKPDELDKPEELWQAVEGLLLFPHTWVRSSACRLIGQRLAQLEIRSPKGVADGLFMSMSSLLSMTRKMSLMLQSPYLDDALALQIVKSLLFVGKCFALVPLSNVEREEDVDESGDEVDDGEEKADNDNIDWSNENPLRWMFTKMSHQLRQCKLSSASMESLSMLQPSSLLKWFAAMVNHLPLEQSRLFLVQIISPLYRLLEGEGTHMKSSKDERVAELQTLATEVQDLVQKKIGTTAYASTYSHIRQKMAEKRKKRKDDALMLAIHDPEKAMRRKASMNQRKHESRKRKTQSYAQHKERTRPIKRQK